MKNRGLFSMTALAVVLLLTFSTVLWIGCSTDTSAPLFEAPDAASNSISPNAADIAKVMAVQNRHTLELESIDGVYGTATGRDNSGQAVIMVMAERDDVRGIPAKIEGIPVRRVVAERPTLFGKPGGAGSFNFKARQNRPVPIGVSIGNYLECAAGTFGCAVYKGGNMYVLSNNHVLSRMNKAAANEVIGQPGLYDNKPQCSGYWADEIARVSDFVYVQAGANANNKVDCAIALSNANNIQCTTPNGYYGLPNSTPVDAVLDMSVQKVGRTTGHTTGTIIGINASLNIAYEDNQTTRFIEQVMIAGSKNSFSDSGDSGSLIVTNNASANPVALLFAGNRWYTYGNTIQNVMSALNVTICGK